MYLRPTLIPSFLYSIFFCVITHNRDSYKYNLHDGRIHLQITIRAYTSIVRGPGAEPGNWVQSFFLNVFILYRYCTL